jgi:hypothetical protein
LQRDILHRLGNDFVCVHRRNIQLVIPFLERRHFQNLFHLIAHARVLVANDVIVALQPIFIREDFGIVQRFARQCDGGDRRFEFVRHVVDKIHHQTGELSLFENRAHRINKSEHDDGEQHKRRRQ